MARISALVKMLTAIDLHETGVELMRQNLRRRHPGATRSEIDRRLQAWLAGRGSRPGGDLVAAPAVAQRRRRPR